MGIFKRRKDSAPDEDYDEYRDADDAEDFDDFDEAEDEPAAGRRAAADDEPLAGPFDVAEAPEDELPRLDLGSVRVPVPDGAQLQVEMDPEGGALRAVHLVTQIGQFTITAFAAPKSGSLWPEVSRELAAELQKDGAAIRYDPGEWGKELIASADQVALRFLGVDGPRWMLRGVVAGPPEHAGPAGTLLHDLVRHTVVVRGDVPLPVRSALPVELPAELAEHIAAARAEQGPG